MAESDMLSALLNDPHALEQALSAASALLGGSESARYAVNVRTVRDALRFPVGLGKRCL